MTIERPKRNLKRLFIFNAILLVVAFAAIQYAVVNNTDSDAPKPKITEALERNYIVQGQLMGRIEIFPEPIKIPNIAYKNVFDMDESLDDLKGQWVVLNIWASWCPPCIKEMPSLQALQDIYGGQGVKVLAISVDKDVTGAKLRKVMQHYGFGPIAAYYANWSDVKSAFSFAGLPTTYILSPNGQAVAKVSGDIDWVDEDTKAFIDSLLN